MAVKTKPHWLWHAWAGHFLCSARCRSRSFGIRQFVCRNKYKFTWPEAKKSGWRCVRIFVEGE